MREGFITADGYADVPWVKNVIFCNFYLEGAIGHPHHSKLQFFPICKVWHEI